MQALATAPEPDTRSKANEKIERKTTRRSPLLVTAIGNEIAHRVLAWDHMQRSEFDAAAEELGDAAALNQNDMWIRYYLSVLKYRMAQSKHADIQGLPNMMQDLRAVLEWYPEFADAYDLMATARMEGGGPVAAMQAERAAMQLSPRNQQYVYNLAEIYIADKKWEAAVALLERLKASGNPQIAAAARERLGQLPNEQKYGISAAAAAAAQKLSAQTFAVRRAGAGRRQARRAQTKRKPRARRTSGLQNFCRDGWWAWTARSPRQRFSP